VQSEDFRLRILGKLVHVVNVSFIVHKLRGIVNSRGRESIVVVKDFVRKVILQNCRQQQSVLLLRHSASVVALARQILQGIEGHFLWVLVQEHLELLNRDL